MLRGCMPALATQSVQTLVGAKVHEQFKISNGSDKISFLLANDARKAVLFSCFLAATDTDADRGQLALPLPPCIPADVAFPTFHWSLTFCGPGDSSCSVALELTTKQLPYLSVSVSVSPSPSLSLHYLSVCLLQMQVVWMNTIIKMMFHYCGTVVL